jgi:hypothetical protein
MTMLRHLLNRIPSHLPKAWVTGILLWLTCFPLMALGILFGKMHLHSALVVVLATLFFVFLCFMGCILWFCIERIAGRVTPWRKQI